MNPLLVAAAAIYGILGIALLFAPDELLAAAGAPSSVLVAWLAQALGAALLALAFLNWFHRFTRTGGILGRPVLLPNVFFTTTAFWIALAAWRRAHEPAPAGAAVVFGILGLAFAARLFGRAPQAE